MAAAARAAGPTAPVPTCPGWSVGDLLRHQGHLHRWVATLAERRPSMEPEFWKDIVEPADDAVLDWFGEGAEACAASLAAAGPDAAMWSWTGDSTALFWARRQAHETAVHRYDAELAAGTPRPVDGDLAVDGIDEAFDILPFRRMADDVRGTGETIHLHCTDREGEWLVRLDPDAVRVTREHAKGDVAARGTASDLFLLLWGRVAPEAVEVFGDGSLVARWQEVARF